MDLKELRKDMVPPPEWQKAALLKVLADMLLSLRASADRYADADVETKTKLLRNFGELADLPHNVPYFVEGVRAFDEAWFLNALWYYAAEFGGADYTKTYEYIREELE